MMRLDNKYSSKIASLLKRNANHANEKVFSLQGSEHKTAKTLLAITACVSFGVCCIENGLPVFFLIWLPLIFVWLRRDDYTREVLFSEKTLSVLLIPYIGFTCVWFLSNPDNRLTLPHFFAFFASGVFLIRTMCPLPDRNVSQLLFLSVGLTLVNCILTNHLIFAFALPFYLFFLMAALTYYNNARNQTTRGGAMNISERRRSGWIKKLAFLTCIVLVVALGLFLLFPRPYMIFPGFRTATAGQGSMASLKDKISYREMVGMGDRRRIAFLVRLYHGRLPMDTYWRGRVLEKADENGWAAVERKDVSSRPVDYTPSQMVRYYIFPYRLHSKFLYVAGLPQWVSTKFGLTLFINSDREVLIDSDFLYSDRYKVRSTLRQIPIASKNEQINLSQSGITPKIQDLAEQWRQGLTDKGAIADTFLTRLRTDFNYKLEPDPPPQGAHPLEYFLTNSKTGNCEYFAGAMGLLLRSVGIPARVVEGFYGMERTEVPNEFLVRFSRAHAWVEADLDGVNWTTLDPTPITQYTGESGDPFEALSDFYDQINYLWVMHVVNYDRSDQRRIIRAIRAVIQGRGQIGAKIGNSAKKGAIIVGGIVGISVVIFIVIKLLISRRKSVSGVYRDVMKDMRKLGILAEQSEWHEKNTENILQNAPSLEKPLNNFNDIYLSARFRGLNGEANEPLRKAGKDLIEAARESRM